MEPLQNKDLKRMLFFAIFLGFTLGCVYVFSLQYYFSKIPYFNLEILHNVEIIKHELKTNSTDVRKLGRKDQGKKIKGDFIDRLQKNGSNEGQNGGKSFDKSLNVETKEIEETKKNFQNGWENVNASQNTKKDETKELEKTRTKVREMCPFNKSKLGPVYVDKSPADILTLKDGELKFVKPGGKWSPTDCTPRTELAVVIPFRNRDAHLAIFLRHMHKFLQSQMISYRIFVVEQDDDFEFNRGKLMNIGYKEAIKMYPFKCFAFHDVDLIPEDTRNDYACPHSPRHMSVAIDKFNYKLLYEELFGGVEAFTREDYEAVNGYSNTFWGWGAEDDNLYFRVMKIIGRFSRPSVKIARYQMLKHLDMEGYGPPDRGEVLKQSKSTDYISKDGLSSLQYNVNRILELPLFTLIKANLRKHQDKFLGVHEYFTTKQ